MSDESLSDDSDGSQTHSRNDRDGEDSSAFGTAVPSERSELKPQEAVEGNIDGARKLRESRETDIVDGKIDSLKESMLLLKKELEKLRKLLIVRKSHNVPQVIGKRSDNHRKSLQIIDK